MDGLECWVPDPAEEGTLQGKLHAPGSLVNMRSEQRRPVGLEKGVHWPPKTSRQKPGAPNHTSGSQVGPAGQCQKVLQAILMPPAWGVSHHCLRVEVQPSPTQHQALGCFCRVPRPCPC